MGVRSAAFFRKAFLSCATFLLGFSATPVTLFPFSPDTAAHAQAPDASEADAFNTAKALGTVEAWDAFLSHYPKGFYADMARAYVKQLAGGPSSAATPPAPPPATSAPVPLASLPAATETSCRDQKALRSKSSTEAAKLRFVNESGVTLVLQWIDFDGSLKEYATLKSGTEVTQDTFLTHPWIVAHMEGSCRQIFLPSSGTTVARLLPMDVKAAKDEEPADHGPTPAQTCRDIGQDYNGSECVPRKKKTESKPSRTELERRKAASCADMGMVYLNKTCQPKKKSQRIEAEKKKNKACPAGMYRNPYGQCQPNETGG